MREEGEREALEIKNVLDTKRAEKASAEREAVAER